MSDEIIDLEGLTDIPEGTLVEILEGHELQALGIGMILRGHFGSHYAFMPQGLYHLWWNTRFRVLG